MPEIGDRWAAPEPIPVVNAVDDETRLEHKRMRNHRIVLRVRVLFDVEIFLHCAARVREERPLRAEGRTKLLQSVVIVRRDRSNLRIPNSDLRIEGCKIQMLLVLLRTVVATRQRED